MKTFFEYLVFTRISTIREYAYSAIFARQRFCYYNELSQKTRSQSVRMAALCLYNIQRENLVFKKSLGICKFKRGTYSLVSCLAVSILSVNNNNTHFPLLYVCRLCLYSYNT